MPRRLLWVLALAGGLSVANLYYIQPLLEAVANGLGVGPGTAGLLVTLTQFGFIAGLVFLIPLGDRVDIRLLVTVLLIIAAGSFVVAAFAPSIAVLAAAMTAIGATSVVAQILVPFAATITSAADRGRAVGIVMTGIMLGTLLSRTISGAVAEVLGWRAMCWLGAALMLALLPLLRSKLPELKPTGELRYSEVLRSLAALVRREPIVRWRATYGAVSFAAFTGFWTAIPFLLADPPFEMGEAAIGAVALIGLPSAFLAPRAGQIANRCNGDALTGCYLALMMVGVLISFAGAGHFYAIVGGGFLVVVGSGCLHVTNQCLIYALDPVARNRLTTAYMSALFGGGMAGSALAATLYASGGWNAACGLLIVLTAGGVVIWLCELLCGARPRAAPLLGQLAVASSRSSRPASPAHQSATARSHSASARVRTPT